MTRGVPALVLLALVACHADEASQAERDLATARQRFVRALDLQEHFIEPTCSPNPGVCHQSREYPELFTVGALLAGVAAPCNLTPPAPELGWDACERVPYRLELAGTPNSIAWLENVGAATWSIGVFDPVDPEIDDGELAPGGLRILDTNGGVAFAPGEEWTTTLDVAEDRHAVTLAFLGEDEASVDVVVDEIMRGVVPGDPNRNGTWGGFEGDRASLVTAGDRDRSYLWRRLIGDVPGDRMPIANGPVTNDQMLALGCWIEGLAPERPPAPDDAIDYDACSFAEDPPVLVDPPVE